MTVRLPALAALAALLPATLAHAQSLPSETDRDLWCGLAFTVMAEEAPADASPDQKALAETFAAGGTMLTDRASAILLENGYSDERLAAHLARVRAQVEREVNTTAATPAYSYEECRALLPF